MSRVHSPLVRCRLVLAAILVLAGCAGVGTEPLPGEPPHHVAGGFKNTNPKFRRPDGWTRWTFMVRRGWDAVVSPRTLDTPRVPNDAPALRAPTPDPTVTWIGPPTGLVKSEGVTSLTNPTWTPGPRP